jgi:ABC-2 type transport system ATP-binding protein
MRSGHATTPITPVLSAGVGARDTSGYPMRLASFRLESSDSGRAVLGIVMPRSAASTTLVGLLSGRRAPAYGKLRVLDHDMTTAAGRAAVRPQIGIASRHSRVWPASTIRKLVEGAARQSGQRGSDRRLMVAAILDRLALTAWAEVPLRSAPDRVARRARLAAACVHEPSLLIIDGLLDHLPALDRGVLADVISDLARDASIVAIGREADSLRLCCDQVIAEAYGMLLGRAVTPVPAMHELAQV